MLDSIKGLVISQWMYVLDQPNGTGLLGFKTADTLMEINNGLCSTEGESLADTKWYQRLVGRLIYITNFGSNIAYAISVVDLCTHHLNRT